MPKRQQNVGYFTDEELRVSRRNDGALRTDPRQMSGQRYVPKNTASANTRRGAGQTPRTAQRPVQQPSRPAGTNGRPVLNERQRAAYERAYFEKYGRLPYRNAPRTGASSQTGQTRQTVTARQTEAPRAPRPDRRQAFLEAERERKIREAAEKRRREAERLKAEADAARRAAEYEERRRRELERELEKRRREKENLRRYRAEKRKLDEQRRREEAERRRAAEERLAKLRRRRHRIRVIKLHLKIFFIAMAAFLALLAFAGYRYFWSDGTDKSRKMTYYYDGVKAYTAPAEKAFSGGNVCVDFTDAAEHFDFCTAGDKNTLKYIIPGGEGSPDSTVEFVLDSNTAVVNGTPVALSATSRYIGSRLWVSCDIGDFFEGGIKIDRDGGRVDISRVKVVGEDGKAERDKNGDYVYEDVALRYKPMDEPERVDLVALYGEAAKGLGKGSAVTFKSDLSAYEEFMNPNDSNDFLIIANRDAPLDVTYIPEDLTFVADTRADGREQQRLRYFAEKALEAMFTEMRAWGFEDVSVTGGFVSYYEQSGLFAAYVNDEMATNGLTEDEAKAAVRAYCDEAGTCDFQTGLSAVLHNLDQSSPDFAAEPVYKWLEENSWKFGYVLRYPQGKSDITGHQYDPCHFRYVGRFAAEIMHKNGWSLEEYMLN